MIPILYESNETKFKSTGLGLLADCTSFIVTEERNGSYVCEFEYPVTGIHFDEIKVGRFVACTHDDSGDVQPFIIYKREVPDLNGIVRFYGYHISYLLSNIIVMPFEAYDVQSALTKIKEHSANNNPFIFETSKTAFKEFKTEVPRLARNILGGEDNSILDKFGGGEYEFDKFTVRLYEARGRDSGVTISYGVNLAELNQSIDNESSYNAVAPYWRDPEGNTVYLPEGVVIMPEAEGSRIDALPLDLTDRFEMMPTEKELRELAEQSLANGNAWRPTHNLEVNFVQLWQTEEYKDYADLQRVNLCDTVTVLYPILGISEVKQKVIKTTYNVLLDRYDSIELGTLQTTLGKAIQSAILDVVPTREQVDNSIRYESDLLRGGLGGYVVLSPGEHRYPEEILIMDTPDKETARNVWRWNKDGIGYSPNGYHGPFTTAWTIDGKFVADFIQAGVLSDENKVNSWDMESGELITKSLTATDYLYVDGNEDTFFRVPYQGAGFGYLEMSQIGFVISVVDSIIRSDIAGVASSSDNVPSSVSDVGGLVWDYDLWRTSVFPYYIITSKEGEYDTSIFPGELTVSGKSGGYFGFNTADENYMVEVGQGVNGLNLYGDFYVDGAFSVTGSKNRAVDTDNYSQRLLYSYETTAPLFGDIGEAVIDEDGFVYVEIDDLFSETVSDRVEYQVFTQKEGDGDCWVAEKHPRYFVIQGTPGLRLAWEIKAKQKGFELERLESRISGLDEYAKITFDDDYSDYIKEQEVLLYGNY